MTFNLSAANKLVVLLAAAAVTATAFGVTSSSAQTPTKRAQQQQQQYDRDGRRYYGPQGPNRVYQQGPRTRVYVTTRSWLDAGVEVQPGDRKFTDYAFPPDVGYPSFARENNNRPIDRQPLSPPSDLGGYPRTFPLY
ncbi:hypothetical protein [Bradyrhizobium genosp. P]|uniref:hypothetical protein n=1 Tax=Bradyrhizobium genosp. P TaxID=83641 RepID=UPI003CF837CF